jgi:hypothetical protein
VWHPKATKQVAGIFSVLLAQRMDDVAVVDDVSAITAALRRPTAPQGEELR